ncbi:small, acid-soluble spore protein L [Terribacillus sp. 179-K 1B1 HS]
MSRKKSRNEKAAVSVNKQGLTEDAANQEPKSQLEQRAKKKNTKI